ncbi:MAG: hypothetical protein EXS59_00045 [Candidatus Taylorbacteria bacterium]|nr:hypothetical protein [Candidatus Taylorbacteria bacterium]
MDTKFQTSFIPKKSLTNEQSHPRSESVSIFLIISIIIFVLGLAAAGGVFAYKRILIKNIADMNVSLVAAKNSFEPTFIDNANALSKRIEAAKKLLTAHTVTTPIFDFLENDTLATVKFDTFSYDLRDNGGSFLVISGQAKNFSSIALQSDIFGKEKFIKNPVFSDLNPDQNGNIVFKFNSGLDPSFLSYKTNLKSKAVSNN